MLCLRVLQAPSYSTELNAANLVYERVGDRLAWQIYRFRSGIVSPDRYRYGPYGRTHGLRHREFLDPGNTPSCSTRCCTSGARPSPRSPPRHSWNSFRRLLTCGPRILAPASGERARRPRLRRPRRRPGRPGRPGRGCCWRSHRRPSPFQGVRPGRRRGDGRLAGRVACPGAGDRVFCWLPRPNGKLLAAV